MKTERQKYKWIVEGAQRAGFNPLTALRAGGGQLTQLGTPLSTGEIIANAVSTGAQVFANNYEDPIVAETRELQNELTRTQIDTLRRQADTLFPVPGVQTTTGPVAKAGGTPSPLKTSSPAHTATSFPIDPRLERTAIGVTEPTGPTTKSHPGYYRVETPFGPIDFPLGPEGDQLVTGLGAFALKGTEYALGKAFEPIDSTAWGRKTKLPRALDTFGKLTTQLSGSSPRKPRKTRKPSARESYLRDGPTLGW